MSGLTEASASGDRVATLQALLDLLSRELENPGTPPAAKAAMARQVVLILAEIAELAPPEQKGTALDELASRRRAAGKPDASSRAGSTR